MSASTLPFRLDLTGEWRFAYTPAVEEGQPPALLPDTQAKAVMPVPGFWDDHLDSLKEAGFADVLRFNPDYEPIHYPTTHHIPDASLPYLVGVGQYEYQLDAPSDGRLTFECGPVFVEAWLWVNGRCVAHQPHYSTTWSVPLDDVIKPGESNRLSLQVANTSPRTMGCITRGYKGYSAGIAGPITVRATGPARIADCYVYQDEAGDALLWRVEIDRPTTGRDMQLTWRIVDTETGDTACDGVQDVTSGLNKWQTSSRELQPWSDQSPKLYRIELDLHHDGTLSDSHEQPFGLRRLVADGFKLTLNNTPIYLRGATEHAYFPKTCTMPLDKETYRQNITKLKQLGFNWLRCHTWVPPEPYLAAGDELGMLFQVEPPLGASDQEWIDILRACRRHPSVVIYCAGNEELLDEEKLEQLEGWAAHLRKHAPDALFNPQEALRGIEFGWKDQFLGDDAVTEPYLHNPRRLEIAKRFSDCFGQYAWGFLSYHSNTGDAELIDSRLEAYERPCLTHEICIHGSYLDLDLEHRYVGTRIGTNLYAEIRRHLQDRGLLHRAAELYANSCAWMHRLRKHTIETARQCGRITGYDLLGAIDHHWHRTGYPCGMMNEFYELKPGETVEDVRRYNNRNVLTLNNEHRWSVAGGTSWAAGLSVSLFEQEPVGAAQVRWCLRDQSGRVYRRGEWEVASPPNGEVTDLGAIELVAPTQRTPLALTLDVQLTSQSMQLTNQWPLWVYPEPTPIADDTNPSESLRVVSDLSSDDLQFLADGGRVFLQGSGPFPSQETSFQIGISGRLQNNLATCIRDHPITCELPHAGFCDWDFRVMMDQGSAILFEEIDQAIDPIIEIISTFKNVQRQAMLFETRVGEGRLLVCPLGLSANDPAAAYLRHVCIAYAHSPAFDPKHVLEPATLQQWLAKQGRREALGQTDEAYDERAQLKK